MKFALTGAAGYIAPRHMKAINDTDNSLVAALDPHDSVGILDRYAPEARFFTESERFDRHLEKLRREGEDFRIKYVSICSPNYLHDAHIRIALRVGADAICEKPLVLNPWNIDALQDIENETERNIYCILQLRYHPVIMELKRTENRNRRKNIQLTYITSRGKWYAHSWKGDQAKSGGLASNIGIHFFDMLTWIYGPVNQCIIHSRSSTKLAGFLELERADVKWFLSIDKNDLGYVKNKGKRMYRSLSIDGNEIEFTSGFEELHTIAYKKILSGEGITSEECRKGIQLIHDIRNLPLSESDTFPRHPLLQNNGQNEL